MCVTLLRSFVMRLTFVFTLLFAIANLGFAWEDFLKDLPWNRNFDELNIPKDQWFTQYLDHFNQADGRTWNQRYFMNATFYKKGGPVFLKIGGEGVARGLSVIDGSMIEYAKQFGAMCFLLEHRYYGNSRPVSDLSVKNLAYLNSEQALADLAYFIKGMNFEHQLPNDTKWIAFGGSYAGSLAAWLRAKYPHLVHSAVSSSAPLLAQVDFQQYFDVVRNALQTHSRKCVDELALGMEEFDFLLNSSTGRDTLWKLFNFCNHLTEISQKDIANLYSSIANIFAVAVQYNSNLRNLNIEKVCKVLVDDSKGSLHKLADVSNMFLKENGEKCLFYKYDKIISNLKNVTYWGDNGARQWKYQKCTEFGHFSTSTDVSDIFYDTFPITYYFDQCADIFGPKFGETVGQDVARTNRIHGGLNLVNFVTKVVFIHGSIDPWHLLGIVNSTNPDAPSIFINGTSHCADMSPSRKDDSPQLIEARKKIGQLIGQWLDD